MKHETYGRVLRRLMQAGTRKGITNGPRLEIRDVEQGARFSYEHIRKILSGEPVVSRDCNDALCEYFGLDREEMWRLAVIDKLKARHPEFAAMLPHVMPPADPTVKELWVELTADQRAEVAQIVAGYVKGNRARHAFSIAS